MSDIFPILGADYALQEAVFPTLTEDAALLDLLGGPNIFDRVPEGTDFPYVSFANLTSRDGSTATERGIECRITLNIWSREPGRKDVLLIMQRIRALLHDQDISLSAHTLINMREEFADVAQQRDRRTFRGVLRFRAFIEPIT